MTSPEITAETKGSRKLAAAVAVTLGLVVVAVVIFSHRGLYQIYRFRHEKARLDQENARLTVENARLTRTIDRLQHDPEMIQEFVRRELNFVKKNEIIFQLPPGREGKKSATPSGPSASPSDKAPGNSGASPDADKRSWSWNFLEGAPKAGSNQVQ